MKKIYSAIVKFLYETYSGEVTFSVFKTSFTLKRESPIFMTYIIVWAIIVISVPRIGRYVNIIMGAGAILQYFVMFTNLFKNEYYRLFPDKKPVNEFPNFIVPDEPGVGSENQETED